MSRLFFLIGTPSPTLYATLNVVRALATAALGAHEVVCANTIDELGERVTGASWSADSRLVLYSDYPQPDVLPAYTAIGAPLVICADDFLTVAHYSVTSRGYGGVDAARFASMGLVNIEPLIVAPPKTVLLVNRSDVHLDALIAGLARFYGLPDDAAAIQSVLDELGGADGASSLKSYAAAAFAAPEPARAILERSSPLENELIDLLAPQYDPILRGWPLERLEWPPFALLRPDFPDRLTVGAIDLTGPARFIYHGPYFALPKGRWRAELTIEVGNCLSDNQIAVDIVAGEVLAVFKTKLPPRGVYGCEIAFEHNDSSNPVEIRVQLVTGAIEGVLMLHKVELSQIAPDPDAP